MQNTNKIKPAFPLSLLTCALALATGVASAQTIVVTNGETYTQNVVATDATTSLTIQGGGTLDNPMQEDSRVVLKPELPAEITLKPYGDPRNVMISR